MVNCLACFILSDSQVDEHASIYIVSFTLSITVYVLDEGDQHSEDLTPFTEW